MKKINKKQILADIKNEKEFREFLIELLRKMGFKNVYETHQYGNPELGKDIIASSNHGIDGKEWHAFVVKHGKVMGGTRIIEEIKGQIKQSFEYPYENIDGSELKINKVKVVTNENFSFGAQKTIGNSPELKLYSNIAYWWNEKLIEFIEENYPDYWDPGSVVIKEYIKVYKSKINQEFEIKSLSTNKISDKKIKKLIELFVTPHIEEKIRLMKKNSPHYIEKPRLVPLNEIIDSDLNFIIKGDPGAGKSRLINKLFFELLELSKMEDSAYPILLKIQTLKENDFNLKNSIEHELKENIPDYLDQIDIINQKFVILIDSLDEMYEDDISSLLENINEQIKNDKNRFIITVRSSECLDGVCETEEIKELELKNFNSRQIKQFIERFFEDSSRGQKLIEVLKESNILEKLPTTPLTLTLISLLYEDSDYEIPATITDIYADFVSILLGKLEVRHKHQMIDFELKKRIYSFLAYEMLANKTFELTIEDFEHKIKSFLEPKGIELNSQEDLSRLIRSSGLFFIDNRNQIGFKHVSFLEYFSALEIFYVRQDDHIKLIENFNDVNWQNAAVFYAGISKNMPFFIDELITKAPNKTTRDKFLSVGGMGYIAQALYATDMNYRSRLIEKSLNNLIEIFKDLKGRTEEMGPYFGMPPAFIAMMLSMWFNSNFKSITLLNPLKFTYDALVKSTPELLEGKNFEFGFKLFLVATILNSKYLNDQEKLNDLIERNCFMKDPLLLLSFDLFSDIEEIKTENIPDDRTKKIKKEIKRYREVLKVLTKEPAYRFDDDNVKKLK